MYFFYSLLLRILFLFYYIRFTALGNSFFFLFYRIPLLFSLLLNGLPIKSLTFIIKKEIITIKY